MTIGFLRFKLEEEAASTQRDINAGCRVRQKKAGYLRRRSPPCRGLEMSPKPPTPQPERSTQTLLMPDLLSEERSHCHPHALARIVF
jgi:hypothetical protein